MSKALKPKRLIREYRLKRSEQVFILKTSDWWEIIGFIIGPAYIRIFALTLAGSKFKYRKAFATYSSLMNRQIERGAMLIDSAVDGANVNTGMVHLFKLGATAPIGKRMKTILDHLKAVSPLIIRKQIQKRRLD